MIERNYIGIALLTCVAGIIVLAVMGKAVPDVVSNVAMAAVGALGGIALPRHSAQNDSAQVPAPEGGSQP